MSSAVSTEPSPSAEFAKFATSDAPLALDQPPTVSLVLLTKSSTKEAAGPNVPPFLSRESDRMPLALIPAPMVSSRFPKLSALLAPSNVPLAKAVPETVPLASTVQSQSTDPAPLFVVKTSSASKDSALLAQLAAMDANTTPRTVSPVLLDT